MVQAVLASAGGWAIGEIPAPRPGAGEVLVKVHAVAVNNADRAPVPGGQVVGYEFAGEITALGPDVQHWQVGDRVMGTKPHAFAELLAVDARWIAAVPADLSWVQAAALPTALLTEHGALMTAGFGPGDTVLITAATGGIALTGVQLVAALGGTAIGTTRTADRTELLERVGAAHVAVGDGAALTGTVLEATGGRGVDIVLDHVGGDTLAAALPATAPDGTLVSVGRLGEEAACLDLAVLAARRLHLTGVSFGFADPDQIGDALTALRPAVLPLLADGTIQPVIAGTFPFRDPSTALTALTGSSTPGKLVLEL